MVCCALLSCDSIFRRCKGKNVFGRMQEKKKKYCRCYDFL